MADDKDKKKKRPTALKRDLQNEKRRLNNKAFKSQVRTALRRFDEAVKKGDAIAGQEQLNTAYGLLDKAVKKGIFKLNKASRTKARLTARLHAAGSK